MQPRAAVTLTLLFVAVVLGRGGIANAPKDRAAAPGEDGPTVQKGEAFDHAGPSKSLPWLAGALASLAWDRSPPVRLDRHGPASVEDLRPGGWYTPR